MKASEVSKKITECKRCLYNTGHPFGLTLDEEGICSGCRVHEEKDLVNWSEKKLSIEKLTSRYRSMTEKNYDCIVPVTGNGDSFYIVHIVKNILRMNPLLVYYNNGWNTPTGIDNLATLRTKFNCDILVKLLSTDLRKKIVRETLYQTESVYWHCLAGKSVFPVQVAVDYQIPLIIWGAHQGLEQTGMVSHEHSVEMTRWYRESHDLMGYEAEDLIKFSGLLSDEDVSHFIYPSHSDINRIGVRGIYLGNFFRWDPWKQHSMMRDLYNLKGSQMARTFDPYDHADCTHYLGIHDLIKELRVGYGKATDHLCREIRHKRIKKATAKKLQAFYRSQPIQCLDLFCEWLGVDRKALDFILRDIAFKNAQSGQLFYETCLSSETNEIYFQSELPTSISSRESYFIPPSNHILFGKGVVV